MTSIIGWITGRNGTFDITDIKITPGYDDRIILDGIGKRGTIINGGIGIKKSVLVEKLKEAKII
jgi:hypothetical protein